MRIDPDDEHRRTASAILLLPDLSAIIDVETRLRIDFRKIPAAPQESIRQFLRAVTDFVELLHFSAVLIEVARRMGARTLAEASEFRDEIDRLVHALTNLDGPKMLQENSWLNELPPPSASASDPLPEIEKLLQAVASFVGAFPVRELTDLAAATRLEEFGARCQVAHDALTRFLKRNDPLMDQRLKIAGAAYATGTLSLADVAYVIELSVPDTVALLEDYGYVRPLEHLSLNEEQRQSLFAGIRQDRLRRAGDPRANSAHIARDVIASQRIEDIDARPWVDLKLT